MKSGSSNINMVGMFSFAYLNDDEGEDVLVYKNCVLKKKIGDLEPGTQVDAISVNVFSDFKCHFDHTNGRSYTFFMDASPVNVRVKDLTPCSSDDEQEEK